MVAMLCRHCDRCQSVRCGDFVNFLGSNLRTRLCTRKQSLALHSLPMHVKVDSARCELVASGRVRAVMHVFQPNFRHCVADHCRVLDYMPLVRTRARD